MLKITNENEGMVAKLLNVTVEEVRELGQLLELKQAMGSTASVQPDQTAQEEAKSTPTTSGHDDLEMGTESNDEVLLPQTVAKKLVAGNPSIVKAVETAQDGKSYTVVRPIIKKNITLISVKYANGEFLNDKFIHELTWAIINEVEGNDKTLELF